MSRIEERMVKNGIPMPAFRKAMREATELMIADGPGTTAGIHDVGVFYVQHLVERYVIRENVVYEIAERDVLKLRPSKGDVTKLTESADVRLTTAHIYTADLGFEFGSSSRSAQFRILSPVSRNTETWKLFRQTIDGKPSYVFAHDTLTEAQMKAITDPVFDGSDQWQGARLEFSLDAWQSAVDVNGYSLASPECSAECDGTLVYGIRDPDFGTQAIAHFRSRALDFA